MEPEQSTPRRASLRFLWIAGVMLPLIAVWAVLELDRHGYRLPSTGSGEMNVLWPALVLAGMSLSGYAVVHSRYGRVAKAALFVLSLVVVFFAGIMGLVLGFRSLAGPGAR